jgi:hypothetical protein
MAEQVGGEAHLGLDAGQGLRQALAERRLNLA